MRYFNSALLSLMIFNFSVNAGTITLYGGLYDCKSWMNMTHKYENEKDQLVKSAISGMQVHWLAGYMTAFNVVTGEDNFPMTSVSTANDFINDYCTKKNSSDVVDGLLLMKKKLKK